MKRTKWLILCLVLCMVTTLSGTIAYLTDTDGDVNVMTLGNVDIHLEELERIDHSPMSRSLDGLQAFQDDKMMHPLVGDLTDRSNPWNLPNNVAFLDKIVRVHCTSRHANAFLRVYIGLPSALRDVDGSGMDALHMLTGDGVCLADSLPAAQWPWAFDEACSRMGVSIDGVPYDMLCFNYQPLLAPGDITAPVMAGLWLDSLLDTADDSGSRYAMPINGQKQPLDYDFSNGLQVPVLAQAVQADGFPDARTAFQAAGMNDVNFDDLLDIQTSVPLSEQLEKLLDAILSAFEDSAVTDESAPPVALTEAHYDFSNPAFSEAVKALDGDVLLEPASDSGEVVIEFGSTAMPDNLAILSSSEVKLVLIGN